MRSSLKFLGPTLAASLLLAACGSAGTSGSARSGRPKLVSSTSGAVVKTASNAKLGHTILVNVQGLTLYRLSGEQSGKFICTSAACTHVWHPLIAKAAPRGGGVGSLTRVKRPDGAAQVAYKGMPLYTFVKDIAPGQDNGQGIKDVGTWDAVSTGAAASAPATAPAPAPASSGGAHAY